MWQIEGLANESDVEQKFLYRFLTETEPVGLGLPDAVIQTKVNLRRFAIGKGIEQKLYYPDYIVVMFGLPLVVVEAKAPNESVAEGYRQARLYAHELNGLFPPDFNPTRFIVASNGIELWYGHADHNEPLAKATVATLGTYSPDVATLQELMSWKKLSSLARTLSETVRPNGFFKPRRMIGGIGLQNEEVGRNSFGATLTASISAIFNPTTRAERSFIARHGYIASHRRERYIDPIDKVIRAARPPSETDAQLLEDTSRPKELIGRLNNKNDLEHKVLLIIGSVGSGKTTFIDYLHEVALPRELINQTVWCRMDMNSAPVSAIEIYDWLRISLIESCKLSLPNEDFEDIEILRKIFSVEINRFNKGVGKLYAQGTDIFNVKLAEHIESIQRDRHASAQAHMRYCCGDRSRLCIIVLDNCDKKTRDEQLLMFEVAQWLQREFRALVILPLRDETYDNHRLQPPLDTALKDMVFRIEPPLFQNVLLTRVKLAMNTLNHNSGEKLHFLLPNGIQVEYPRSDQAYYLTSIIKSLFEHDRFVRRMIVGLSGRNMRDALEIFLEFCNSAHIGEDQIFKIRQSEGRYTLPLHQVATVLMRMNRRYYDSDYSYVKNLFSANQEDSRPSFFCRYMILRWLREKFSTSGTDGLKGYYRKGAVKQELMSYGLSPDMLDREFNYLLSSRCILAEHLRIDSVTDDDLVRIGPAGFVHLDLVGNVSYLAAVAEDTFFLDRLQAEKVVSRIRDSATHLHIQTAVDNASELVEHLLEMRKSVNPAHGTFLAEDRLSELTDISDAAAALERVKQNFSWDPWFDADKRLRRGSTHVGTVVNVVQFGCFVELPDGLHGLVHTSKMNGNRVSAGDRVQVEVIWVDVFQKKMSLKMLDVIQEDAGDLFGPSLNN
ncbi:S1 RNA-binding domain-containing protein [Burkholderia vietnamiensis]|uniref:S1 RNA-binding domain-containing protein n=1 Tax=Burkholderia vietnamiensis TaxID=60552 RepID=A0ABS1AQU4_BURVI|nr:type I restriction endonuclease [Burkholderia vietnamiensis]MBJ9686515.1 S1 RNA-binding domain-containing protein [Burkholderia vietnamiensis]